MYPSVPTTIPVCVTRVIPHPTRVVIEDVTPVQKRPRPHTTHSPRVPMGWKDAWTSIHAMRKVIMNRNVLVDINGFSGPSG
jgi:hypothetical protein